MENVYIKECQVSPIDVDYQGKIKIEALLDYLMEAASVHAAKLGVSVVDMFKMNLTWILSRYHLKIYRYPKMGEHFSIATWPSTREGNFTSREFVVTDKKGDIVKATTSWLALDLKTKRPVKMDTFLPNFNLDSRRALDDSFESLPKLERIDAEKEFPVFMSHLDINRHVTSNVYIQWALEAVPEEVLFKLQPAGIEISYRAEAFYGDRIISRIQSGGDTGAPAFIHQLCQAKDEVELARLRTTWQSG